jgi:lipopolysaccharide/colanic/teichoic acid biosynthesis glycosyltransferase
MTFAVPKTEIRCDAHLSAEYTPSFEQSEASAKYFRWTGWLNRLGAAILLAPALPMILFLIFLVRLTSYGPGIYRQTRVGRGGRTFTLYKIRTMMHDAEALTGPVWTAPNDPRITKVGKLLRAIHLDELPQLLNVLRGHMALIGPRPERPEFTQYLSKEVAGYMSRYVVPPGITGLAQINLPPDTDVDSVRRKLILDLEYIHTADARMDLKILLCTAVRLFGFSGMAVARKLGLLRNPEVSGLASHVLTADGAPSTFRFTIVPEIHAGGNGACKAPILRKDGVPTA